MPSSFVLPAISLQTGDAVLDQAFCIAMGDLAGNIHPLKSGLLDHEEAVLMAGLDYNTPWTRDAAINVCNGVGLLFPQVAHATLLSVLYEEEGTLLIGGQYWDAIIWAIGAWSYYLSSADVEFLTLAFQAVSNTLDHFERTEWNPALNLFRGPACYGDGVAAYPDRYARTNGSSSILDWPAENPLDASTPGYGLPMSTLSTNCLYYEAYILLTRIARELHAPLDPHWQQKAQRLKESINAHFWNPATQQYRYLLDQFGISDVQEGLGNAFALLFGIADTAQVRAIMQNQHRTPHGIPCLWPPFERYQSQNGQRFGRHCGVIWPHIQAFWAQAAAQFGYADIFVHELVSVAQKACRDSQFAEIYHPITGQIYGGVQEGCIGKPEQYLPWKSCSRQSWSASGYMRMLFMGLLGMSFDVSGITFRPTLPEQVQSVVVRNLPYRSMTLDIEMYGHGQHLLACTVNNQAVMVPTLSFHGQGQQHIIMHWGYKKAKQLEGSATRSIGSLP